MRNTRRITLTAVALAAALSLAATGAHAARARASIGSGPPGTAVYIYLGGLAAFVSRDSKSVELSNVSTRGAVEDMRLVESGKTEFGLGVSTLILRAFAGKKPFRKKYTRLRAVGPAVVGMWHVVTYQRTGITSVAQLAGKRLNFSRKGSSTHFTTQLMVKAAGISVRPQYINFNVMADAMKDNRLDAFTITNPIPAPPVSQAAITEPIRLIPMEGEVLAKLLEASRAFYRTAIPAGAYPGVDKEVPTIGFIAWTVTASSVPADVVYEVTRLNYSAKGRKFLESVHKAWRFGFREAPALGKLEAIGLRLHPGAARYWKEQGHKISAKIAG